MAYVDTSHTITEVNGVPCLHLLDPHTKFCKVCVAFDIGNVHATLIEGPHLIEHIIAHAFTTSALFKKHAAKVDCLTSSSFTYFEFECQESAVSDLLQYLSLKKCVDTTITMI